MRVREQPRHNKTNESAYAAVAASIFLSTEANCRDRHGLVDPDLVGAETNEDTKYVVGPEIEEALGCVPLAMSSVTDTRVWSVTRARSYIFNVCKSDGVCIVCIHGV